MDKVKSIIKVIFVSLFFSFLAEQVIAADALSLYGENDSRYLKPNGNTDRHYTNGAKIVYLTQPDWQWLEDFSKWHFATPGQPMYTAVGFFIGQNIYTPDNIAEPANRKPEDMVFAGWLYTGMFIQRATEHQLDHIELNVGVIGPSSLADQVQDCFHNVIHSDKPQGWENQLNDEMAADVTYMHQQRLLDGWFAPTEKTDVITEYGFTAGSVYRLAQAGVTFRYGFNLGNTFGPGRLSMPSGISTLRNKSQHSGYLFARAGAKAVEYNRFLTGLSTEPLVGELQVGAVYTCKKLEIGYSQTFFTQEYKQQTANDSFSAVTVAWQF